MFNPIQFPKKGPSYITSSSKSTTIDQTLITKPPKIDFHLVLSIYIYIYTSNCIYSIYIYDICIFIGLSSTMKSPLFSFEIPSLLPWLNRRGARRRLPRGHGRQRRPVLRRHGVAGGQGRCRRGRGAQAAAAETRGARQPAKLRKAWR